MKTSRKKTPAAREERRHGAFLSSHTFEENCGGDNFTASLTYLHRCLRRCRANYIKFFFFWQGCFSVLFSFNSNKWTALCDLLPLSLLAASGSAPCAGTLANEDQHRWRKLISFNSVQASWDRKKSEAQSYFWTEINYWSLFHGDRCQKGEAKQQLRPSSVQTVFIFEPTSDEM